MATNSYKKLEEGGSGKQMTLKIGRNDPCPCGSGKKYKQCCADTSAAIVEEKKGHDGAVERALSWLMDKHRKAVHIAIEEMIFDGLSDEEREILEAQDKQTWQGIQLNATEWLLSEGHILVKGEHKRVSEYLLGQGGPLFTVDQRRWIAQLADRPLRLYEVTDVIPGKQMILCDALNTEALPITVYEKSGSQASQIGMLIGLRIMEVDGHFELSGAGYPFSQLKAQDLIAQIHEAMDQFNKRQKDFPDFLSLMIRRKWLEQFYAPMPMPTMMDAYSGEPMLLITDHYRIKDWEALTQSLSSQSDVQGDRKSGWDRLVNCEDGATRATVTINIEKTANKITLFYKTQSYADTGRPWFAAIADDAVQLISRELSDPKGMMANMPTNQKTKPRAAEPDIPPEVYADIIEKTIYRLYANWADESIQALGGKTPRQAIKTPAGLERVKGLLRSYEANEKQQAVEQGRREISYEFLWRELKISP